MKKLRYACINCHFLMKEYERGRFEIKPPHREAIANGDFSWLPPAATLACYRGVWDEGYGSARDDRVRKIVLTNRKNSCLYYPFSPGMFFPAAQTLQEKQCQSRQSRFGFRLSIYSIIIAILSVVVAVMALKN